MIRETWSRLAAYIERPRRALALVSSTALASGLVEALVLVLVVRVALVAAGQTESIGALPIVGVDPAVSLVIWVAVALSFANIALHYVNARLVADLSTDVFVGTRRALVQAFAEAPWDRQAKERNATLHESVSTLANETSGLSVSLAGGLTSVLHMVALLGVALLVDAVATVVVIVAGVVMFFSLRPVATATKHRAGRRVRENSTFLADLDRSTSMAMELRAFGVEREQTTRLDDQLQRAGQAERSVRTLSRFGENLYRDVAISFLVVAVAVLYLIDTAEIAGLGAVVLLVVRAANSAQGMQYLRQAISSFGPSFDELERRLDSLRADRRPNGTRRLHDLGPIELRDVSYAYDDQPALRHVDLTVTPGEALGVIGPSGGGKSTLVQVLLRLRPPTDGAVLVHGAPYEDVHDDDWSRLVSIVPQEPHLMEGTIHDNIAFLRSGVTDADVERAARLAHIWDEIQRFPDGIHTRLGARGQGLSGGQRQRVAIARAIVAGPQLLVLDEPSSALDPDSEERLRETLVDLTATMGVVIVTHRPIPLAVCDRVVRVEDGVLSEVRV